MQRFWQFRAGDQIYMYIWLQPLYLKLHMYRKSLTDQELTVFPVPWFKTFPEIIKQDMSALHILFFVASFIYIMTEVRREAKTF